MKSQTTFLIGQAFVVTKTNTALANVNGESNQSINSNLLQPIKTVHACLHHVGRLQSGESSSLIGGF